MSVVQASLEMFNQRLETLEGKQKLADRKSVV